MLSVLDMLEVEGRWRQQHQHHREVLEKPGSGDNKGQSVSIMQAAEEGIYGML